MRDFPLVVIILTDEVISKCWQKQTTNERLPTSNDHVINTFKMLAKTKYIQMRDFPLVILTDKVIWQKKDFAVEVSIKHK